MVYHAIGQFLKGAETYVQPKKSTSFCRQKLQQFSFHFLLLSLLFHSSSSQTILMVKVFIPIKKYTSGMCFFWKQSDPEPNKCLLFIYFSDKTKSKINNEVKKAPYN
jgi:hypothetical protein